MVNLDKFGTFEDYLTTQAAQISAPNLIGCLALAAVLSFILGKLYVKYGISLSNRKRFAKNFALIATTTTLVITIVKSSLALSLGLVGALSIVRFRAAIKEPEELAFLFLCISIGLGLGANQILITIVSFATISVIILLRHFSHSREENQNLCLTVSGKVSKTVNLKTITNVLKKYSSQVRLKRFDQKEGVLDASFLVDFDDFEKLNNTRKDLNRISKSMKITYLDTQGIIG